MTTPQRERRTMIRGLIIGTLLGLLLGAAFVGATNDWSWLIFTLTLGWALGIGIGVDLNPSIARTPPHK